MLSIGLVMSRPRDCASFLCIEFICSSEKSIDPFLFLFIAIGLKPLSHSIIEKSFCTSKLCMTAKYATVRLSSVSFKCSVKAEALTMKGNKISIVRQSFKILFYKSGFLEMSLCQLQKPFHY